jgi:dipeptidyl aminopeptidase/acylaminoacyl peptidase
VLSGLAFTPELYRVGVALVPPADLGYTLAYSLAQPSFVRRQPSIRQRMIALGSDYEDPAVLQQMYDKSPQAHLEAIAAPLLVSAGADDDRIDIRHVKDYSLHLLNKNKKLALLIDEDEGHGLLSDEASEMSLYLTEAMLAQHLGGRLQALDDPLMRQYLDEKLMLNTVPGFLQEFDDE